MFRRLRGENERLQIENDELVRELWHEWWDAHAEYCSTDESHAVDTANCYHPRPAVLEGRSLPETLARPET